MAMLVTGGCGFIGSHFIKYQLNKNPYQKIINLDKLTYAGNKNNIGSYEFHSGYNFYQADICDENSLLRIFENNKIDVVVNFAAESHVDRSIGNSYPFVRSNIMGTQSLLDVSKKFFVKKFIQISTDEVYGSIEKGEMDLFTEETPMSPNSPYSASKASADMLVLSYYRTHGLPVIITRCSNNYGTHQYPEKLIPLFIKKALKDEKLPVYGDGRNIRDWIHVSDHVAGISDAIEEGRTGEIYNFGGEREITNLDLTKSILSILDKPEGLIEFVEDRLGHDFRYAVDFSKSKRELGWKPKVNFENGLKETVEWYIMYGKKINEKR